MKVVVIHGDDIGRVQSRVLDIIKGVKKKGWEISFVSSSKLREALNTNSLFDDNVLFVLEQPEKLTPKDLEWLSSNLNSLPGSMLVGFKKSIPAKIRKSFPSQASYEEFKLPQLLFTFLESIYPGNSERTLQILKQLTVSQPLELVFAMLARHLRDLYWVSVDPQSMNIPDWRQGKLASQARKFPEGVRGLIDSLAKADIQAKTSELPLSVSVDLLLIKHLQKV